MAVTVRTWSEWLTGRRDGSDPGWDPMAWMVAETHARNLEFHAWFNPYRASQPATSVGPVPTSRSWRPTIHSDTPGLGGRVPGRAGSRLYYDPGIPQARQFVEDSILEAVERYDIDGVHFDDFFYPYPEGGDSRTRLFTRYGKGVDKADWRRTTSTRSSGR